MIGFLPLPSTLTISTASSNTSCIPARYEKKASVHIAVFFYQLVDADLSGGNVLFLDFRSLRLLMVSLVLVCSEMAAPWVTLLRRLRRS